MQTPNYLLLACPTLRREIEVTMAEKDLRYPVFYLPNELHQKPEDLNKWLCDFIARLVNVDYVLLPMGLCGNGTLGVPSGNCTLVLPKSQDCISLLLSDQSLADVDRPKYDFFFTDSWLDGVGSTSYEYDFTVQKYGKETAASLMKMMYKHYKYFTYIDSGYGDYAASAAKIAELAEIVDVEIRRLPGNFGVLRKMLALEFDDDFLIVPPGEKVFFEITSLV
jgi:hypothetical protein